MDQQIGLTWQELAEQFAAKLRRYIAERQDVLHPDDSELLIDCVDTLLMEQSGQRGMHPTFVSVVAPELLG